MDQQEYVVPQELATQEQVLSFSRTIKHLRTAEAIGQLMLAFDMDLVAARTALVVVELESHESTRA